MPPVLLILFLSPLSVPAAGLTEKVQETYRNTQTLRADFVQKTFVEVLEREIEERGEILFSRPGRFVVHYQGGRERKFISDGKTLWIYHPREKEVEVFEDLEDLVSREALAFVGGLGEMTKEFRVSEKGGQTLELVPRRKGARFLRLLLTIDPETSLVREATLFPRSGNQAHYTFSKIRRNEPVSESVFHAPR